ncbi:MAG: hypothetical protein D6760_00025, partial [Deltaproteobacteria bacterium]
MLFPRKPGRLSLLAALVGLIVLATLAPDALAGPANRPPGPAPNALVHPLPPEGAAGARGGSMGTDQPAQSARSKGSPGQAVAGQAILA